MECRDSLGTFNSSVFSLWTCSLCYIYLFPKSTFKPTYNLTRPGLISTKDESQVYHPEVSDQASLDVPCDVAGVTDCKRWKKCCLMAVNCCEKQRMELRANASGDEKICPRTWDGWSCFDDAVPSSSIQAVCPGFLKFGDVRGHAVKQCTENGTWARHPLDGSEWTDYSGCVDIQAFRGVVYAGVIASSLSLVLLVPACAIFLSFRQLRSQQRIRLHVHLFTSFTLASVLTLLWEVLVYDDRTRHPWSETFMVQHEGGCRTIYILLRYARCTNYSWMFCEGLYLHRLLVNAFTNPRHIRPFYLIGWGIPTIPVIAYSAFRWTYANDICWVKNAGGFEWILYTPNLLCILMNMAFLLGILRILLTQLHQHPNEPSNYRRALKATFVLIPLFGIQLFLVIYRPNDVNIQDIYEIVSTIIIDSQGGVVALIFCYFNKEVLMCLRNAIRELVSRKRGLTFATTYTVDVRGHNNVKHERSPRQEHKQGDKPYIALQHLRNTNHYTATSNDICS